MSGRWATSTRRARLPRDWPARVRAVRARSRGRCEHLDDTGARCPRPADGGVDHWVAPDDHRIESLRDLCHPHHTAKTQAEAAAGRHHAARDPEPHPGLR